MKFLPVIMFLVLASCAFTNDQETELSVAKVKTSELNNQPGGFVEDIAVVSTPSIDKKATMIFYNTKAIKIELREGKVSYKDGHSVAMKADSIEFIHQVDPTEEEHVVRVANPQILVERLKGKKKLQVELLLNETGARVFEFPISQDLTNYLNSYQN
jgi:hypothetical protein